MMPSYKPSRFSMPPQPGWGNTPSRSRQQGGIWPATSAQESHTIATSPCKWHTGRFIVEPHWQLGQEALTLQKLQRWIKDTSFCLGLAGFTDLGESVSFFKLLLFWDYTVWEPVFKAMVVNPGSVSGMNTPRIRRVFANLYSSLTSRCLTAF